MNHSPCGVPTVAYGVISLSFSILQSQFIEKGFKKAENYEQNVVLLLFVFTLDYLSFTYLSVICLSSHEICSIIVYLLYIFIL